MSTKTRRAYTEAFKAEAVRLAQIPQLEAGLGSQVTVSPNEFLFFDHDNFHRVQLRRSSTWVC